MRARREVPGESRRAVTFIKEIVPRAAALGRVLTRAPDAAFLAEGSRIEVHMPVRLEH